MSVSHRHSMVAKPAIVLACHKLGLGVIRALGRQGVPVVAVSSNRHDMGTVSRYVTERHQCPEPESDPVSFMELLERLAARWAGGILIPCDDAMLVVVSKNRDRLARWFHVAAPDWSVTRKFIEKRLTYEAAGKIGVACPRTCVPASISDAQEFLAEIGYPCVLKPSVGHRFYSVFKTKMLLVKDADDLADALNAARPAGVEMMIQEFIPGSDRCGVNYNSYWHDGKPVVEFTARKVRLTPPTFGFPRVVMSERLPDVVTLGRRVVRELNPTGFSCTEFKWDDRDQQYKLMEVNGRQNLSGLLAVKCNINFPYVVYRHMVCGETPRTVPQSDNRVYWVDVERDVIESIWNYSRERFAVREYLRPYMSRHIFAVLSMRDPMPVLKRAEDGIRNLFSWSFR